MLVSQIPMVLIFVSDVDRSADWYQQTLDLPLLYKDEGFASFQVGDQRLAIHSSEAAGAGGTRSGSVPVFEVADYASAKTTLEERGCAFHFENETPNARFGSFTDPDGNPLQIMQSL